MSRAALVSTAAFARLFAALGACADAGARRWLHGLAGQRERARRRAELRSLDAATLRDLGVGRAELEASLDPLYPLECADPCRGRRIGR